MKRASLRQVLLFRVLAIFVAAEAIVAAGLFYSGSAPLRRLDAWLLALFAGVTAAAVAVWLGSRGIAQPIEKIADAAETVAPESLDERIDVDTSHAEIARLQLELNEALARIETGYRAQEAFISNVSHELKTPISVLLAESQMARHEASLGPAAREFVDSVEEEMRHLGRLVESFLMLARAEHGEQLTRRVPVSINDVVMDAVQHSLPVARRHEVRVVPQLDAESEPDGDLVGDPELLQTMLENLIRNAIRFSPAGRGIEVTVSRSGRSSFLSVRDWGPGIPDEILQNLFERYVQAPGESLRVRGTGLGLAITRKVAELHGGTVTAENCADGGCVFTVEVPLAIEDEDADA